MWDVPLWEMLEPQKEESLAHPLSPFMPHAKQLTVLKLLHIEYS